MDTKKLRQKILDLAIRGKLVPQDPNDEPASVLLERIRAEKEQLIKEGKIKRSKKSEFSDKPHYENVPFKIPESWVWTTIDELLINRDSERIPLASTIRKKQVNKVYDYYGAAGAIDKVEGYIFNEKLLLIGEDGANLLSRSKDNAFFADGKYWVNNHAHVLDCCYKSILTYVAYLINSISLEPFVTGTAQPKLSQDNLNKIPIALPPLEEQTRIVTGIEKWLGFIDEIENGKIELGSHIKLVKSKILDLAISGKLVPQDPNDEPAIELLKRINPNFVPCDNSHYENLPEGWVKLRLGDVCGFERGITFPSSAKCTIKQPGMIACIRTANVQDNLELDDLWYVGTEYIKGNTEKLVRKNDIIMSSANSRELVGKVSYVHDISEQTTFGGFVLNIRAKEGVLPFYLFLMLKNLYLKGYHLTIATQTTNIANLNTKILSNIEVLLPPLTEQKRIINSVTNILANIENITAELS